MNIRERYEEIAKNYLHFNGYSGQKLGEILSGFDFNKPAYEQKIDAGNILYQFVRRSSHYNAMPKIGNWFCLSGAELSGLAIISGGEGRIVAKILVEIPFAGLEGVASAQSVNWGWSGGGTGGATQIFVPDKYIISNIRVLGYSDYLSSGIATI